MSAFDVPVRAAIRRRAIPRGLIAIAAGITVAIAVSGVGGNFTMSLLLGLVAGSYVLALSNPVWALAPILITELAIPGYLPSTSISMRLAVSMASVLIATPAILRGLTTGDPRARRVILPGIAFVVLVTMMNSVHSSDDYVFKYFRYQFTQIVAMFLAAFLIRTRQDLKHLAVVALLIATVSGFAATWQHFEPDSALYASGSADRVRDWKGRAIGLSLSPVNLAADLPFVLLPLLGYLAAGPLRFDRPRLRLAAMAVVIFVGCYFSYTRSAMPAIGVGLAMIALYLRGYRRTIILGGLIGVVLMFPLLENTGLVAHRFYRSAEDDRSAASHEAAWQVGLAIALDHPVEGIGHERYAEYAPEYVDVVGEDTTGVGGTLSLEAGTAEPHNDFLNVWFSWGIAALILHVLIYLLALRNCVVAARSPDLLVRGIAIGTAGGLIAYAANSLLHNYMDSNAYLWIYAGLSVALVRIARAQTPVFSPAIPLRH